ncbi:MAG: DUF1800 domain-containing protein [Bacteroidota bacterium]
MGILNCTTSGMATYVPSQTIPWNKNRVQHLFRRMGFGLPPNLIETALAMSPESLVDLLIDEAIALPLSTPPEWADWPISRYGEPQEYIQQAISWAVQWTGDMLKNGFREKMTLFWHNHFVTELETYRCPSWQYQYHKVLQENALGNFKRFVVEIGKTPAMLVYLNGVQSTRREPNENYARELYELFTLGRDNGYTQQDIEETSRALTGWNSVTELCAPIQFFPLSHDSGRKTIFGRTGNWGYEDVHDLLFEERANEIATFICTKIYRHFVSPNIEESIVAEMADTFKTNNFEIVPVLRQLFKSEHFFDDKIIGTQIKSPIEFFLTLVTEWGLQEPNQDVIYSILLAASQLGQSLFNPVDVAGWQEDRAWMDSNTISIRWQVASNIVLNIYENNPSLLVELARYLSDDSNDPYHITEMVAEHMLTNGFANEAEYERATTVLKGEVPENYFEDGYWNLDWETAPAQVASLVNYLVRQPEFQLM